MQANRWHHPSPRSARRYGIVRRILVATFTVATTASLVAAAPPGAALPLANPPLEQISSDPYRTPKSQHATEAEPESFSFGSTIVSAFQVGRYVDARATNIGWATSTDAGRSWQHGFLPGITEAEGGPWERASQASVAYDAAHDTWLITSGTLNIDPEVEAGLVASRSTDGGLTWHHPVTVFDGLADKPWIVCDDTSTSPYYGHCYAVFTDGGDRDRLTVSTSTDGGVTWGPSRQTIGGASGYGVQPVVQPDGTVVVVTNDDFDTSILSFRSTDGGASWSGVKTVTAISWHRPGGLLRDEPLPSADIDASGRVYVVWHDCRFRIDCRSNDLLLSTSDDGRIWSVPARIPLDPVTSRVDHFLPGLAVQPDTSGDSAHLALTFYFYPDTTCTVGTCHLTVGYSSSPDRGQSWTRMAPLAGPMKLTDIAATTAGRFVGTYISTSYAGSNAFGFFSIGNPSAFPEYDQAIYTRALPPPAADAALVAVER